MVYKFFKHEFVFLVFFLLFILLSIMYPKKIICYPSYIHWDTILTLCGLLIITTSIKESGFIDLFALRILKNVKYERSLALYLVVLAGILSTFLTNDISLFIVIPITISLQRIIKEDIPKLIIFEALAVNAGSTLTPIGNPQNIYLWHKWGGSFINFTIKMFPVFVLQMIILTLFVYLFFRKRKLQIQKSDNEIHVNKKLFFISIFLFFIFIIAIELDYLYFILPVILAIYFFINFNVLKRVDWMLIVLFIIIFIDFNIIANLKFVQNFIGKFDFRNSTVVFILSLLISQIISNVPATVFISKFSSNWFSIAYGVNIGGNGIFIASLANIIALRMAKDRKIWFRFHNYSIPFLLINFGLILFFLMYWNQT